MYRNINTAVYDCVNVVCFVFLQIIIIKREFFIVFMELYTISD